MSTVICFVVVGDDIVECCCDCSCLSWVIVTVLVGVAAAAAPVFLAGLLLFCTLQQFHQQHLLSVPPARTLPVKSENNLERAPVYTWFYSSLVVTKNDILVVPVVLSPSAMVIWVFTHFVFFECSRCI